MFIANNIIAHILLYLYRWGKCFFWMVRRMRCVEAAAPYDSVCILVSLQKKNTFEAAARSAAVSATRRKARVYAISSVGTSALEECANLKNKVHFSS